MVRLNIRKANFRLYDDGSFGMEFPDPRGGTMPVFQSFNKAETEGFRELFSQTKPQSPKPYTITNE